MSKRPIRCISSDEEQEKRVKLVDSEDEASLTREESLSRTTGSREESLLINPRFRRSLRSEARVRRSVLVEDSSESSEESSSFSDEEEDSSSLENSIYDFIAPEDGEEEEGSVDGDFLVDSEDEDDYYDSVFFLDRDDLSHPDHQRNIRLLGKYARQHPRKVFPEATEVFEGVELGVWCKRLKRKARVFRDEPLIESLCRYDDENGRIRKRLDAYLHAVSVNPKKKIKSIRQFIYQQKRRPGVREKINNVKRVGMWYEELKSLVRQGGYKKVLYLLRRSPTIRKDLEESLNDLTLPINFTEEEWKAQMSSFSEFYGRPTATQRHNGVNIGAWYRDRYPPARRDALPPREEDRCDTSVDEESESFD